MEDKGFYTNKTVLFFELLFCPLCYRFDGNQTKALNLGSYNYLGFAENEGACAESAEQAVIESGLASCSTRHEYGMIIR